MLISENQRHTKICIVINDNSRGSIAYRHAYVVVGPFTVYYFITNLLLNSD